MTTGLIICGALAREVLAIVAKYGWDAHVMGVPAIDHVYPQRIAPHVEKRILALREQYDRLIVVYGDCGSQGALDVVLDKYGIERLAGPHCYDWYGGEQFQELVEEEPGTYFLTDFMIRTFEGLIKKSMGLDRYPQLKEDYFHNYKRVVYLAQVEDEELLQKAQKVADYLELPLEVRVTGYNRLETQLVDLMSGKPGIEESS
ncbi:MAG TPA: DUF1638 domain-containing protein [Candidatus Binatia bacterium]|nr:DUF1638 domain-containing protein [Candidatus Binatia bacterium]